jgi:hypothetical protein
MLKITIFTFLIFYVSIPASALDYCDPILCPTGTTHIGCNNTGEFHQFCPPDRKLITLTSDDRAQILLAHDYFRNRIAMGSEPGFLEAQAMYGMVSLTFVCQSALTEH